MATIKQVAKLAGVSTATVSRVTNNTACERVKHAMRPLNYRRDMTALAKHSGNLLGLLTGNLADPFFGRLARGVESVITSGRDNISQQELWPLLTADLQLHFA